MQSILTETQANLLRREKAVLGDLRLKFSALGAAPQDLAVLQDALLQLDELFLLVVVGEFNAGKSRLVNALLGRAVLPEGVLPTTSRITVVRYGDVPRETPQGDELAAVTAPAVLLSELTIVDTPGTNAIVRRHEQLTREFVPRSDLVLFVTSADRPFSESERVFMELIRTWGKKVVIAVNKVDILESDKARREVLDYVTTNATTLLGTTPEVFATSAKLGLGAWRTPDDRDEAAWQASGLAALEKYIRDTLNSTERVRLKFENPLGVAERVLENLDAAAAHDLEELGEDVATAATIEQQLDVYGRELGEELAPRVAQTELILRKLEARGLDFFDNTIRLTNILQLARGDRIRIAFERDVLADMPQQVEQQVQGTIDWLVEKDLRQWQQVSGYLQRRQASHADRLVGQVPDTLDVRRRQLLEGVGDSAAKVLETYDRQDEAQRLAGEVEQAVAFTALAEAGAVGLGAAVVALLSASFEPTGLVAAGTVAILGLFIIPAKRRQAKERFADKIADTRLRLSSVLTTQFNSEADRSQARLRDAVAPYTRFVRGERERLAGVQQQLSGLRDQLAVLRMQVKQL